VDLLKALATYVPPWTLLAVCLLVGAALFGWRRTRRLAVLWLLAVGCLYVLAGLPVVANHIGDRLPPIAASPPAEPIAVLIVFDGDNRRGRLAEALRILREDAPRMVWVLGEEWFLDEFAAEGYRGARVGQDATPANTREQVDWVQRLTAADPGVRPAIIVSRLQAPRVASLAAASKLDVRLIASPIDDEPPRSGWRRWVPSYIAFRTTRDALYEHAALAWYAWNGWIE
jgi:hypothetical protein